MTDIHTHALPGVDDGAKNIDESLGMLRYSYNSGVKKCVLTPHCFINSSTAIESFTEVRDEAFAELCSCTRHMDDVPKLLTGAEVYCDHDISRHRDIDKLCICGTNMMLVEFPLDGRRRPLSEWIYSLNTKGITVIAAHVERYADTAKILEETKGLDIVYQINASSFMHISSRRKLKKILLCPGKFIAASDMHNMTTRKSRLAEARDLAQKRSFGAELFRDDILRRCTK